MFEIAILAWLVVVFATLAVCIFRQPRAGAGCEPRSGAGLGTVAAFVLGWIFGGFLG